MEGPAVIILEDLHDSDQGSKELLAYLIRHRGRLPLLNVLTFRKGKGEPFPGFLSDLQGHFSEVLQLTPFTYEEHIYLLQSQAENGTVSKEMAKLIYQRAEGNPFKHYHHDWQNLNRTGWQILFIKK